MPLSWRERKCRCGSEIRPIIDPIHAFIQEDQHDCHKNKLPHCYDSNRLNQYLRLITPNNYPFQQKLFIKKRQPYKVCDNLHKRIKRKLKDADGNFIEREEEYFKNQRRYNLRSLDLEKMLFNVDD